MLIKQMLFALLDKDLWAGVLLSLPSDESGLPVSSVQLFWCSLLIMHAALSSHWWLRSTVSGFGELSTSDVFFGVGRDGHTHLLAPRVI